MLTRLRALWSARFGRAARMDRAKARQVARRVNAENRQKSRRLDQQGPHFGGPGPR